MAVCGMRQRGGGRVTRPPPRQQAAGVSSFAGLEGAAGAAVSPPRATIDQARIGTTTFAGHPPGVFGAVATAGGGPPWGKRGGDTRGGRRAVFPRGGGPGRRDPGGCLSSVFEGERETGPQGGAEAPPPKGGGRTLGRPPRGAGAAPLGTGWRAAGGPGRGRGRGQQSPGVSVAYRPPVNRAPRPVF